MIGQKGQELKCMFVVASDDVSRVFVSSELVPAVKVLLTDGQKLHCRTTGNPQSII